MSTDVLTPLVIAVIGIPVLWIAIWVFTCWVISLTSGWRRLAKHYRSENRPPANARRVDGVFGMLGMASYRGTLNLAIAPDGLYLDVMRLFAFGHPTLFIAWTDLSDNGHSPMRPGIVGRVITIGKPAVGQLRLPEPIARQVLERVTTARGSLA